MPDTFSVRQSSLLLLPLLLSSPLPLAREHWSHRTDNTQSERATSRIALCGECACGRVPMSWRFSSPCGDGEHMNG